MKRIALVTAAATTLAVGGLPFTQAGESVARAQNAPTTQRSDAAAQPAAARQPATQPAAFLLVVPIPVERVITPVVPYGTALAPDGEEIRDTIASATEAALTDVGFDDLVERLVDADRNRIGRGDTEATARLVAAVERVQAAWQRRFEDEFDIEDESSTYAAYPIVQGVITAPLRPAEKVMAANDPGDYNLDPGREVAVVTVPSSDGLPAVTVTMINEAFGWKIDIPNEIGGVELANNLASQLDALTDSAAKWPADRLAAQRFVTHHVLLALMGEEARAATAGKRN